MRVLDDVNARSLAGFGCESFAGDSFTGFTDGDCLWDHMEMPESVKMSCSVLNEDKPFTV